MRILFISYELPPIGGGGGRAAWQIAQRLARREHDVCILSSQFQFLPATEERDGVRICRLPVRRSRPDECSPLELLSFMRRSVSAVVPMADGFGPQVACAFFGIPGGPAAWWLNRQRGTPYLLSLRGSDVPRPEMARHQRLHRFTKPFLRRIYRRAAGIVAVSPSLRDAAHAVEPNVAIEVVPNGIDTDFFQPPERSGPGERAELLFVGRLREFKGVQYLLRALPMIERRLARPVRLTVAGEGPYRPALDALVAENRAAGSQAEVCFKGWLEGDAVRAAYAGAELFVLPSLVEGHPNVALEAMAMGLPVVATDVPGTRDALVNGEESLLAPPENPEALARAIVEVLSDPKRWRAMSRKARARAMGCSWDRITDQYEQALLRAAGRGAPCAT